MLVFGAANSGYEIEICPGHGIVYAASYKSASIAPRFWLVQHLKRPPAAAAVEKPQ